VTLRKFPPQFWLLFAGMLISTVGASMIWPFLMIYISERLDQPLATVTSLLTLNAAAGVVFSFISGQLLDQFGRKWLMVVSLAMLGVYYLLIGQASTLLHFALLMVVSGAFQPLYRVGADAMLADLIPAQDRPEAYSLMRMSNNLGVSVGPAVGGFIAASSYSIAFYIAAGGMLTYSLLMLVMGHETLPATGDGSRRAPPLRDYLAILKDRDYVYYLTAFTFTQIGAAIIWVLLGVHTKTNFGIPENLYGFIPATNAIMVVALQYLVTNQTKKHPPLPMMALGALFFALGVGSVAMGRGFWAFWTSMVVVTIGELILMPTSTTYVARLAPVDKRGRYMSLNAITWSVATGIGPLMAGAINDTFGSGWMWLAGGLIGLLSAAMFLVRGRRVHDPVETQTAPANPV
jgi:MFS family permease